MKLSLIFLHDSLLSLNLTTYNLSYFGSKTTLIATISSIQHQVDGEILGGYLHQLEIMKIFTNNSNINNTF